MHWPPWLLWVYFKLLMDCRLHSLWIFPIFTNAVLTFLWSGEKKRKSQIPLITHSKVVINEYSTAIIREARSNYFKTHLINHAPFKLLNFFAFFAVTTLFQIITFGEGRGVKIVVEARVLLSSLNDDTILFGCCTDSIQMPMWHPS